MSQYHLLEWEPSNYGLLINYIHDIYAVRKVWPDYPNSIQNNISSDTVVIKVTLNAQGRVRNTQLVKSNPILDEYAIAAAKQWVFNGTGRIEGTKVIIPFNFKN